jgi:hypothetical protein
MAIPFNTLVQWDADLANPLPYSWTSKQFYVPYPTAYRMARVSANSYLNTVLTLFADGVQFYQVAVTSEVEFAIPQQVCLIHFSFTIAGTDRVTRVQFVEDAEEFR